MSGDDFDQWFQTLFAKMAIKIFYSTEESMSKLDQKADEVAAIIKDVAAGLEMERGLIEHRERECVKREADLAAREAVFSNREKQQQNLMKDLALARTAKKAAEDREAALAEKLRQARQELGAKTERINAIEKAFPQLVVPVRSVLSHPLEVTGGAEH